MCISPSVMILLIVYFTRSQTSLVFSPKLDYRILRLIWVLWPCRFALRQDLNTSFSAPLPPISFDPNIA